MARKILLIEPKYRNKYPPIGLMKIATYHRMLGDNVRFYKGDLQDLALDELTATCVRRLTRITKSKNWQKESATITKYIKAKNTDLLAALTEGASYKKLIEACLNETSAVYRKKQYDRFPKWDRVYVTTLFTFYWNVTVEAIHYAKHLVRNQDDIHVGGVLASLLHVELENETGIKAHKGLLDKPGILDPTNRKAKNLIIDNLPLDYSILDEIDYEYPTGSAYFTFMTKGCTRKCAFCSVPILEPTYKPKIETVDKFSEIKERYGDQQHLLLMDNNVLASPNFPDIIAEIKEMGFSKNATFIEPNQLDIAIENLKSGWNDRAYIRRSQRLISNLLPRLRGQIKQQYFDTLLKNGIINNGPATKKAIISTYKSIKNIYEKYRSKTPRARYVDFNQGTDARYVTDDLMRQMSEIPIRPLRIAFDYWGIKDKYENAVRLAAKYGLKELSNYILYNFNDSPDELYKRLEINVNLNNELGTTIFSFPMKYIPLFGEDAKHRDYIGKKWNRKFIRAVQSILNVTKGIVAPGQSFFVKAFGKDLTEFHEILNMPEEYIIYRYFFEGNGFTKEWRRLYQSLTAEELSLVQPIVWSNNFESERLPSDNEKLAAFFRHYSITKEQALKMKVNDIRYRKHRIETAKLIKADNAINLTLTYDFEPETTKRKKSRVPQAAS